MTRLSALDASFLAVESERSPMHVGWVSIFDGPRPGFAALLTEFCETTEGARLEHDHWQPLLGDAP